MAFFSKNKYKIPDHIIYKNTLGLHIQAII